MADQKLQLVIDGVASEEFTIPDDGDWHTVVLTFEPAERATLEIDGVPYEVRAPEPEPEDEGG